jgi:hypothetical protein
MHCYTIYFILSGKLCNVTSCWIYFRILEYVYPILLISYKQFNYLYCVRKGRKVRWIEDTGDGRREGWTDGCGLHMRCLFLCFLRNARSWMHCRSELCSCGALTKSSEYDDITLWSHWSKIIMELSLYTPGSCPVKHSHGCVGGLFLPLSPQGSFPSTGQMDERAKQLAFWETGDVHAAVSYRTERATTRCLRKLYLISN